MPRGAINLKLVIDVTYQPNGVRVSALEQRLGNIAIMASSNGMFTGDTKAEVEAWEWKILHASKAKKKRIK